MIHDIEIKKVIEIIETLCFADLCALIEVLQTRRFRLQKQKEDQFKQLLPLSI